MQSIYKINNKCNTTPVTFILVINTPHCALQLSFFLNNIYIYQNTELFINLLDNLKNKHDKIMKNPLDTDLKIFAFNNNLKF